MKNCGFCAEEIQDAAIVCRWCGRDVPHSTLEAAVKDHIANGWAVGERTSRVVVLQKTGDPSRTLSLGDDGVLFFQEGQAAAVPYQQALRTAVKASTETASTAEIREPSLTHFTARHLGLVVFGVLGVLVVYGVLAYAMFSDSAQLPAAASSPASNEPPQASAPTLPPRFQAVWKRAVTSKTRGQYAGYAYSYARAGEVAAAVMTTQSLPRNDTVVIGAIADFAQRAFGEDLSVTSPTLLPGNEGTVLAFEFTDHAFHVLIIKNSTAEGGYGAGEPHTLLMSREVR